MSVERKRTKDVYARHSRSCAVRPCNCQPSFRVKVRVGGVRRSRTFRTLDAAVNWRDRMFAEAADWRFRQAEQGRKTLTDVSAGYASLRKTQQVMDALVRSVDPPVRGVVRESLTHLYAAEDALKEVV